MFTLTTWYCLKPYSAARNDAAPFPHNLIPDAINSDHIPRHSLKQKTRKYPLIVFLQNCELPGTVQVQLTCEYCTTTVPLLYHYCTTTVPLLYHKPKKILV